MDIGKYIYIYAYLRVYVCIYNTYIIIYMYIYIYIYTTEEFFEIAIESWPERDLDPRPLNSV